MYIQFHEQFISIAPLFGTLEVINNYQIYKFDAVQKRAVKWIFCQFFEHYSDDLYVNKQKKAKYSAH